MEQVSSMRVLQGVTGQAAQPGAYAAGLRENGVHADSCTIIEHKFGYAGDFLVATEGKTLPGIYAALRGVIDDYDVFHFHGRSFINKWPLQGFPALMDIIFLKLHGKRVYFHFIGQEVRISTVFAQKNPHHYVREAPEMFTHQPDRIKVLARDFLESVCDGIFARDPEIMTYVPSATIIPRALAESDWPYVGPPSNPRPVVLHAPSNRIVKGTDAFLRAVDVLRSEGYDFDVRLIENMPYSEAVAAYREADIIVDQLRIGWYGVLAVEALALGKPTVAYIREDLWQASQDKLPIVNANPGTIADKLRLLISDAELRRRVGERSREFFLTEHTARKVGARLLESYSRPAKPLDLSKVSEFFVHQNFARAEKQ